MLALTMLFASLLSWAILGANTGWTKTSVTRMKLDPITEIEFPVVEERFVPGIDFVVAAMAAAALIYGLSFVFGRKPETIESSK